MSRPHLTPSNNKFSGANLGEQGHREDGDNREDRVVILSPHLPYQALAPLLTPSTLLIFGR